MCRYPEHQNACGLVGRDNIFGRDKCFVLSRMEPRTLGICAAVHNRVLWDIGCGYAGPHRVFQSEYLGPDQLFMQLVRFIALRSWLHQLLSGDIRYQRQNRLARVGFLLMFRFFFVNLSQQLA
jgi:hypothetical protein